MAGSREIGAPMTKLCYEVAQVLVKTGYLSGVEKKDRQMVLKLKYSGKVPAVTGIRRVSKPGSRRYMGVNDLPKVWGGLGINIITTPKGVMDSKQAKKLNSGGELLLQVW